MKPPERPGAGGVRPEYSNDEVDYLLSGGRLGGSQLERISSAVVESARGPTRRRWGHPVRTWKRFGVMGLMVAGVAASFLLWSRGSFRGDRDPFRAKGGAVVSPLSMHVECLHATLAACPRGSLIAFSARGASENLFMTAALEPRGPGARVRLLSNEPTSAQASSELGLLARGARLPADQAAGAYRLEVLVTRQPLPSDQSSDVRPELVVARARFDVTVPP